MTAEHSADSTPFDTDLGMLGDVMRDPRMQTVFDKVRDYNELLASQRVPHDEVRTMILELDELWSPFIHQRARVSGRVIFENDDDSLVLKTIIDRGLISNGFVPIDIEDMALCLRGDANELDDYQDMVRARDPEEPRPWQIALQFFHDQTEEDPDCDELDGDMLIEDLFELNFDTVMTRDRAIKLLGYHLPESIEDIDVALLNDGDECKTTLALKGLEIDLRTIPTIDAENDSREITVALTLYASSLFKFDEKMGYKIEINGRVYTLDDEDHYVPGELDEVTTIAAVHGLVWTNAPGEDDLVLKPHLYLNFLTDSKDDPGLQALIPIDSVQKLSSARQILLNMKPDLEEYIYI